MKELPKVYDPKAVESRIYDFWMKGGFFKKRRYLVPFIRVQDTDTRQGVLLNAFKLADVTVSTAANEHVIPGLAVETAEKLRNRVAELAASAREDA